MLAEFMVYPSSCLAQLLFVLIPLFPRDPTVIGATGNILSLPILIQSFLLLIFTCYGDYNAVLKVAFKKHCFFRFFSLFIYLFIFYSPIPMHYPPTLPTNIYHSYLHTVHSLAHTCAVTYMVMAYYAFPPDLILNNGIAQGY